MARFTTALVALVLLLPAPAAAWNSMGYLWSGDLDWSLNSNGSSTMSFSQAQNILQDAYDEWEAPGCTDFNADYQGSTSRTSTSNSDGHTTHGFLQNWPSAFGSPTGVIGITWSSFLGGEYYEADVSFNEEIYTFIDGDPGGWGTTVDLNSIAVHEFGHSLGLDHSTSASSSMNPSYSSSDVEATLNSDDIDAICTLYPGSGSTPDPDDDEVEPPTGDDNLEPNDVGADSSQVDCGDVIDGVALDQDWFIVTTGSTGALNATLTWASGAVDLDLYLFDATETLDASETWSGTEETVTAGTVPAGTYWLLVNPYEGTAEYTLGIVCSGTHAGDDDDDDEPETDDDDDEPEGDDDDDEPETDDDDDDDDEPESDDDDDEVQEGDDDDDDDDLDDRSRSRRFVQAGCSVGSPDGAPGALGFLLLGLSVGTMRRRRAARLR
jgi:MYXO-CTERM domain-containing protein